MRGFENIISKIDTDKKVVDVGGGGLKGHNTTKALLKSFDNITTNEAFNENQKQEALEDAEFEKLLEEIRNRNDVTKTQEEPKASETKSIPDENPAFNDNNDIKNKRSEKNRNNSNKNR